MLVQTPLGSKPPRDHGATYRTHYNGREVVRRNARPRHTASVDRLNWLDEFAETMRLWSVAAAKPPGATPTQWATVALPIKAGGATFGPAPVWPGIGAPYPIVWSFSATSAGVRWDYTGGVVIAGAFSAHFDVRPGFNFTWTTPKSHYTVAGSVTFPPGPKAAGFVTAPLPGYWQVGETIRSRLYMTKLDGTALGTLSGTAVIAP